MSLQGCNFLAITLHTLVKLGIPVATHKTEGPTTILVFLGILIDTDNFELHLPAEKLSRLQQTIQQWVPQRTCTRQELELLLGHLSHAATVIPQGQTFLQQLFALLLLNKAPHHYLRLKVSARADLMLWQTFLQDWNGTLFFPVMATSIKVFLMHRGHLVVVCLHGWFQLQWPVH